MESGRNKRVVRLEGEEDDFTQFKRPKLPALASVIVEALKVDSLQRLSSSLEPLLRRIVSEEIERALTKLDHSQLPGRSSPPRITGPEGKNLQLHFRTRMPPHLFTGGKVEGEHGAAIHVVMIDQNTGSVVQSGVESAAKLTVVVLEGDFNEEDREDWTKEHFDSHELKEREGKRPLLTGELQVALKGGVGTLGDLSFTDNSSWIRSRKFRLGVKVAPGNEVGIRVREAKTEAFAVKDHRGELYKKHYPPVLHDEVWRLDRIAKDGALHKRLMKAQILTVQDFLRILVKDPQKLRNILGSGMSNRMWENTVEHAKTCDLDGKLYIYYSDESHSTGIVFNRIYELRGLIADGQFLPLESLTHSQKMLVDSLMKRAYENWTQVLEYDGEVLNSLNRVNMTETRVLPATSMSESHIGLDQFFSISQNERPELDLQSRTRSNHQETSQLVEFPFVTANQRASTSCTDFMPVGAYHPSGNWSESRDEQGYGSFLSEEIRLRSSEMMESDDMQRMLRNFRVGVEMGHGFGHPVESCYSFGVPYETQTDHSHALEHRRGSGKAVVGWLKLKAALRWGIFIRKKAAERRAQLIELD